MKIDLPSVEFTTLKLKASNFYPYIAGVENYEAKDIEWAFKKLFLRFIDLPKTEKLLTKINSTLNRDKFFTSYTGVVNKRNLNYHKYLTIRPCYFQALQNDSQIRPYYSEFSLFINYNSVHFNTIQISLNHSSIASEFFNNDLIVSFETPSVQYVEDSISIDYFHNNNGINPPVISITELITLLDNRFNKYFITHPGYVFNTYYQVSSKTESDLIFSTIVYYKIASYKYSEEDSNLFNIFYSLLPFIASETLRYINLNRDFGDVTIDFTNFVNNKFIELITAILTSLDCRSYTIEVNQNYLYGYINIRLVYNFKNIFGSYSTAQVKIRQEIFYHIEEI